MVSVTDDRGRRRSHGIAELHAVADAMMVATSPFALIGTPATIVDDLLRRAASSSGFSYVIVGGDDIEAFAPVVAGLAGT